MRRGATPTAHRTPRWVGRAREDKNAREERVLSYALCVFSIYGFVKKNSTVLLCPLMLYVCQSYGVSPRVRRNTRNRTPEEAVFVIARVRRPEWLVIPWMKSRAARSCPGARCAARRRRPHAGRRPRRIIIGGTRLEQCEQLRAAVHLPRFMSLPMH